MTFIKNAIAVAAETATTAALTDGKASKAKFNGGAGDDFLFVQGDKNLLIGCVGDDTIFSEGNENDIYGDVYYDYLETEVEVTSGCGCCKYTQPAERPTEGGNDQIYSWGNYNAILGGVGEDTLYSDGDYNYIEDYEGSTTLRNFGENNSIKLADATHDIVSIGSNTDMELGDGEHKILIAGKNNAVSTGNGAFKLIFMGDLCLNGGDVVEDDECSTAYNRIIETFTRLATKIEKEGLYSEDEITEYWTLKKCAESEKATDKDIAAYECIKQRMPEYALYDKYAPFAETIGNYTPPKNTGCNRGCQWIKELINSKNNNGCECQ